VLVEAMWVLSSVYRLSAQRIASTVEMLLSHRDLAVQDAETVAEAVARFRQRPSVSFSDCLVLAVARKAGHSPLGTFDRGLARLEGTHRL
jgi:predicted nucleic-acid-binding protein